MLKTNLAGATSHNIQKSSGRTRYSGEPDKPMSEPPRTGAWTGFEGVKDNFPRDQVLDIVPVPKPRMTQTDKWKKRKPVVQYFSYANHLKLLKPKVNWTRLSLNFVLPMPKSWSNKKRREMVNKPHQQKPDLDNLVKAFKDALLKDDSKVWCYGLIIKTWGIEGKIILDPSLRPVPNSSQHN